MRLVEALKRLTVEAAPSGIAGSPLQRFNASTLQRFNE